MSRLGFITLNESGFLIAALCENLEEVSLLFTHQHKCILEYMIQIVFWNRIETKHVCCEFSNVNAETKEIIE